MRGILGLTSITQSAQYVVNSEEEQPQASTNEVAAVSKSLDRVMVAPPVFVCPSGIVSGIKPGKCSIRYVLPTAKVRSLDPLAARLHVITATSTPPCDTSVTVILLFMMLEWFCQWVDSE